MNRCRELLKEKSGQVTKENMDGQKLDVSSQ
jgi:hypothetical protein